MARPKKPENQVETNNAESQEVPNSSETVATTVEPKQEKTVEKESGKTEKEIHFDPDKKYKLECSERANGKYYGCTGELIVFDENGIAIVCEAEAKHFGMADNCKVTEYKGE